MNRFFAAVLIFPVIFAVIMIITFGHYNRLSKQDFLQLRLNHAMNSANDAAMWTLQHDGSINNQVEEQGSIEMINPHSVWSVYKRVLGNYFTLDGDAADRYLEDCTPIAILATNTGFFTKQPYFEGIVTESELNSGNNEFTIGELDLDRATAKISGYTWSRRIPYAHAGVGDSEEAPIIIIDTISGSGMYKLDYSNLDGDFPTMSLLSNNSPEHSQTHISRILIEAMTNSVNQVKDYGVTGDFYIPAALTEISENSKLSRETFRGYALMVAVQNFNPYGVGGPSSNFSISNTQLVESQKWLCMSDGTYKLGNSSSKVGEGGVDRIVSSKYIAASYGYKPAKHYLQGA